MNAMLDAIDEITRRSGRKLAWLCIAMALLTCTIVILRDGFNWGNIALQEAVMYMHGCVFMLGAAYTLQQDGHIRVDIFYRHFNPRTKAWVNATGTIMFLIPLCCLMIGTSWHYVLESWTIYEDSPEPGGIPAVFLLKTLIPLLAATLLIQGITQGLRAVQELTRDPSNA